jgi:hypothetical protein
MSEQMKKEFENWAVAEGFRLTTYDGSYAVETTDAGWRAWQASRQALVVELPTINDVDFGDSNGGSAFDEGFDVGFSDAVGEFKARLCKAGVSYK